MQGRKASPQDSFQFDATQFDATQFDATHDSVPAAQVHAEQEPLFPPSTNANDGNLVLEVFTETTQHNHIKVMIKSSSGQDISQLDPQHSESEMETKACPMEDESQEVRSLSGVANLSTLSKSGRIDTVGSLERDHLFIEGRVKPSLPLRAQRQRQQQRPASSASVGTRAQDYEGQRLLTALSDSELQKLRVARSKMRLRKQLLQPTRVMFDASEKVVLCVC